MNRMLAVARREFASYFRIPMAVVVLPAFLGLVGLYFYSALTNMLLLVAPRPEVLSVQGVNINDALLIPFFGNVMYVFMLVVPVVTMRLVAEERKSSTWELLLTYPVRPWQILWGKYLGALGFVWLLVILTMPYPAALYLFGRPELATICSTYIGIFLFLMFFIACGLMASLCTENQIIAALICFGISLGFILLRWLALLSPPPFEAVFAQLLLIDHLNTFAHGFIRRSYFFIYPSMTLVVLLGCFHLLRTRR